MNIKTVKLYRALCSFFLMPNTPYVFVVWAVPLANTMFLRQRSLSMTLFDNNRICTMGSNIAPNGVLFFGISGVLLDIWWSSHANKSVCWNIHEISSALPRHPTHHPTLLFDRDWPGGPRRRRRLWEPYGTLTGHLRDRSKLDWQAFGGNQGGLLSPALNHYMGDKS